MERLRILLVMRSWEEREPRGKCRWRKMRIDVLELTEGRIISVYTDRQIDFEPVFFTDGRVRLMVDLEDLEEVFVETDSGVLRWRVYDNLYVFTKKHENSKKKNMKIPKYIVYRYDPSTNEMDTSRIDKHPDWGLLMGTMIWVILGG